MKVYHYTEKTQLHRLQHGDLVILEGGEVKTVTKCLCAVFFGYCDPDLAEEARKAWAWVSAKPSVSFSGCPQWITAQLGFFDNADEH